MIGGQHIVSATATQLDSSDTPCRVLTIRLNLAASRIDFKDDVDGESHGYLIATADSGESWTFGPFGGGMGIRPSNIYIVGTAGDKLFWNGLEA